MDRITGLTCRSFDQKANMLEHQELTKAVIGCAYKVYNKMGFGFLESVYEKCLLIELDRAGLQVKRQQTIPVMYEGQTVGEFYADMVVNKKVIVELSYHGQIRLRRKVRGAFG